MKIYILEGFNPSGNLVQVLVPDPHWESNPKDFFVSGTRDIEIIGELEVEGDTQHLIGAYTR